MSAPRRPAAFRANRSMPPGTVIPELAYPDVDAAAAWLCAAFGFVERLRIGDHRAQLAVGDGSVVVTDGGAAGDARPAAVGSERHSVMVRVADADAHCARARERGAVVLNPPTTYPFGERQYAALDLAGHRWVFSQTVDDVDPSAWGGRVAS